MNKTIENIIPNHVGFIMDGNRRWAKARGLPALKGHIAGQEALHEVIKHAVKSGIKFVSVYAFSTENWKRDDKEVGYLMKLVSKTLIRYIDEFVDNDIKIAIVGTYDGLSNEVLKAIQEAEHRTAHCKSATVAVCFNYGGHREIVDAVHALNEAGEDLSQISEERFAKYLYHPEIPPVDLVIRTSGEWRLSNFMLWRSAYSEFIFRDEMWPDFTVDSLDECLVEYSKRQRRFGG